ncbi:MAG: FG-GAP repeat protein [Acidobacteriota bacterium]
MSTKPLLRLLSVSCLVFVSPVVLACQCDDEVTLTQDDPHDWDALGISVALDGDTLIASAVGDDTPAINAGSAYVFAKVGGSWSQQAKLVAPDAAKDDSFAWSVDVHEDTAIVGAVRNDAAVTDGGSAYVWVRDATGTWSFQAQLTASDAATGMFFGSAVTVHGDRAAVGAREAVVGGDEIGAVYVYVRDSSGTWTEEAKLTASDAGDLDSFGDTVKMEGERLIVGAPTHENFGGQFINHGAVYVFERSPSSGLWSEQAILVAADRDQLELLGSSLDLSGDSVIAGGYLDDEGGGGDVFFNSGSAWVFVLDGGTWVEQAQLNASDLARNDHFGIGVSISGDRAAVGAWMDDDGFDEVGSVSLFQRLGSTWAQCGKQLASDAEALDRMGRGVAIDGPRLAAGIEMDENGGIRSGSVRVWECAFAPCPANIIPHAELLVLDEDALDETTPAVVARSFGPPFCGKTLPSDPTGDPAVCVNDDIAAVAGSGLTTGLFTRIAEDVTPLPGMLLDTGTTLDGGLFELDLDDPPAFMLDSLPSSALSDVAGEPLGTFELMALQNKVVCAKVKQGDVVELGAGRVDASGAYTGLTALHVRQVLPDPDGPGPLLPPILVDALASELVPCACAVAVGWLN